MRGPAVPDGGPGSVAAVTTPTLVRTRAELEQVRAGLEGTVAVVMTMGALHDGHATLVRRARERATTVLVTIFLNPLQFGAGEDLAKYPRTIDADLELLAAEGVDIVFAPAPDVVYPDGDPGIKVSAGGLGDVLEGASRPGHFDGVLTVVAKLLHLVRPDLAYFGQKDAQQLLLIRRMVRDLDFPTEVVAVPTVREPDGLAMSSRNAYLIGEERERALGLHRALEAAEALVARGERNGAAVLAAARAQLDEAHVDPEYLELRSATDLAPVERVNGSTLLAVAARVGRARLIDNKVLGGTP